MPELEDDGMTGEFPLPASRVTADTSAVPPAPAPAVVVKGVPSKVSVLSEIVYSICEMYIRLFCNGLVFITDATFFI